jgi:hypothetical protein
VKVKRYKELFQIKYGIRGCSPVVAMLSRRPHRSQRELRDNVNGHVWLGQQNYKCDTPGCQYKGWGPMLRNIVWRQFFRGDRFRCERCMLRIMGRPIGPYDLRDCPMNWHHPVFQQHGLSD